MKLPIYLVDHISFLQLLQDLLIMIVIKVNKTLTNIEENCNPMLLDMEKKNVDFT